MGVCYSEVNESDEKNYRRRRKNKKKLKSIIEQQKSFCENSFASKVDSSFREDLHKTLSSQLSMHIGQIVELSQLQLQNLQKSLETINRFGDDFDINEVFSLCNFKTKNFLHTHKIKDLQYNKCNQVSACPYNSNHILQYDLWKLIKAEDDYFYIYHPFTQMFLSFKNDHIVCQSSKWKWKILDLGKRRNGGFIRIIALNQNKEQIGQLCMKDQQGLLPSHRRLGVCSGRHVSHFWEINFGEYLTD